MAIQSQPSRIPQPFAGSGTKNTIPATNTTPTASQAASWASGFPPECSQPISAGGCPVPRNDMNVALNQISQDYSFRQDGGIWAWASTADYDTSRMVRGSDGQIYVSVAQSGPGVAAGAQDPVSDSTHTYWTQLPTDSSTVVHTSGLQNITGPKIFDSHDGSNSIRVSADSATILPIDNRGFNTASPSPSEEAFMGVYFVGGDDSWIYRQFLETNVTSASVYETRIVLSLKMRDGSTDSNGLVFTHDSSDVSSLYCRNSTTRYLGASNHKWSQVWAEDGMIQTSDERLKSSIAAIPDAVLDAWGEVSFAQFQFNDAVAKKGEEEARLHCGVVAQRIDEAFKAEGLDAARYGFFCFDRWDADADTPAGESYSIRYAEALCLEAAYQRRRADRAEARLAALEDRLAAIEAKLNA